MPEPATLSVLDNPDASCGCRIWHRPKPYELHRHHIWPLALGGPDNKANTILLCPTAHANVHVLIRKCLGHDIVANPHSMAKGRFSYYERNLAYRALKMSGRLT